MFCMVGLNCVDIVNFLPCYPIEDSDQRCLKQSWERGGNASNNATILSELGANVEFFGTLANDHLLPFFTSDFDACGISCKNCPIIPHHKAPTSIVICSEESGSRTIVHYNGGLPELTYQQFSKLNLSAFSWVHFEGRNVPELVKMLQYLKEYNQTHTKTDDGDTDLQGPSYTRRILPVSVEVEKSRHDLGQLLNLADVLFIGKEFAVMQGCTTCRQAAEVFSGQVPKGTLVICPWSDEGAAFAIAGSDKVQKVDAVNPGKVVDSLGAGDTFIASTIYSLQKKRAPERSIQFGCTIASKKLSMTGFKIREIVKEELDKLSQ